MPRLTGSGDRRGMTLVELLVTMILVAIIGSAMTRVLVKQQQYYRDAAATADAKRELRLGATVLPAELRSISSSGGDVLVMSESEITMRAYIGSSIVCERTAAGDRFWVPPTDLAHQTLTTFVSRPEVGDTIFVFNENDLRGAEDDQWEKRVIASLDNSLAGCAGAPFTDPAFDVGKARIRYHMNTALPDSVKTGAVVRFSRPVRYKIYQESSGTWYLGRQEYRSGAWQSLSPLAGPYRPFASGDANPSGLQFRYFDTLGVRITNMAQTSSVARVDVYLRTNAGVSAITERQGNTLRDSVLMRVGIRNYR
jgi:prepilin-type N-terminal cleavage/methylation domain-containing protein